MQKITIETIKDRCKNYTEAFGYYSCRKTDFDWLINKVGRLQLLLKREKNKSADLLFACRFAKAHIKKNAHKKALPILRAAIAKAE